MTAMDVVSVLKIPGLAGGLTAVVGEARGGAMPGTELPANQVVLAAEEARSADRAAARRSRFGLTLDDVTERQVSIDAETQAIVHRNIDARTGEVVSQVPDRALLGMRAYIDRLSENRAEAANAAPRPAGSDRR
jgi:hypothetical protein